uniref:TfoX/Sxy family protein n=1 Tax=Acinetobacter baumannii TaxID=470 RepID=UPI00148951B0
MAGFAPVRAKRMFGGFGIFWQGLMLAIIIEDKLYFKVDDVSEPRFAQRGLPRFQYASKGRTMSLRYCEAPPEVYDEPGHMAEWARLAYE